MTEEEVAAMIAAKISEALAEADARHKAEIAGLEKANATLITEKQNAKIAAEAAADAAQRAKAEKTGDLEALKALNAAELKREQDARVAAEAKLETYAKRNAIATALGKANVNDAAMDILAGHFEGRATIVGDRVVVDGLPVETVIADFCGNEANRSFVRATPNGGMSTTGSTDSTAHQWTKAPVTGDEMNKWFALQETNPALANSLADSWNQPELRA